ncbi:SurA N-terminal domain-containing protein, partial [Patescibacteria group bacterium]|nr:SurA N-terminal domain-containing protein [Patescibacteria group bacterium]
MNKAFDNKPRLIFGVGFFVILVMIGVVFFTGLKSKDASDETLAMVGSEKITKKDVDERIVNGLRLDPESVTEDRRAEVLESITEQKIIFQKADELRLSVTQQEIVSFAELSNGQFQNPNDHSGVNKEGIERAIKFQILKNKVTDMVISKFEADYIKIRFDRHFPDVNNGTDEERKKDKEYATKLRDDIYKRLIDNAITFENAQLQVQDDSFIDMKTYKGHYGPQYGKIEGPEWYTYFLLKSDAEQALKLRPGVIDKSIV